VSRDDGKFKDGCCTSSDEPEVTPDEEVRTALEFEEHSGEDNRESLIDSAVSDGNDVASCVEQQSRTVGRFT